MEAFDRRLTQGTLKGKVNLGLTSLELYLEPSKKAGSEAGREWVCAGSVPSDRVLLDEEKGDVSRGICDFHKTAKCSDYSRQRTWGIVPI